MINLIDRIIEIDRDARGKVEQAEKRAGEIHAEAERKCDEIRKDYFERAEKRLSIVDRTFSKFADEEIALILNSEKERIAAIEKIAEENSAVWEKELLGKITGGCYEE